MSVPRPALVAFHMVAPDLIPQNRHNIAVVTTCVSERLELSRTGTLRARFTVSVGADSADEAVQLLQKHTFGGDLLIVTECEALKRAANEKNVETIAPNAISQIDFDPK